MQCLKQLMLVLLLFIQATVVMSDKFTYTKVLGSARRSVDIIDISKILTFSSTLVGSI